MNLLFGLLLSFLVLSGATRASATAIVPDVRDDLPLRIFLEDIAPLDRPSGHEESMRALVRREVERARENPGWRQATIELLQDEAGNQLVRLPGTGRFARSNRYTAIQAHHDMVFQRERGSLPSRGGIDVVETDGWIHSRNYATTLGADNGLGVAMALSFIRDPSLEHEPLELLFTVKEEITMVGAKNLDLPLKSECLINLDSEVEGEVAYGCLGGKRVLANAFLPTSTIPSGYHLQSFEVSGLPMGHSGVQIHEPRPNAAKFAAKILQLIFDASSDVKLVSLVVGDQGSLNAIPGALRVTLASSDRVATTALVEREFQTLRARSSGAKAAALEWSAAPQAQRMFGHDAGRGLVRTLANLPNGVLNYDPEFPNLVRTSSNLGYVEANGSGVHLGYMIRSYRQDDLDRVEVEMATYLKAKSALRRIKFTSLGVSPPWLDPADSIVMRAAEVVNPNLEKVLVPGGLEIAIIKGFFPSMSMISFGPTIVNPHSPREAALVASVPRTFAFLRKYLIELGSCEGPLTR